jgi:archaeosine-15-forming tRNA-guanine transglycosylase
MGRKPVGKVAMTPAGRQRLYIQRPRDKAAAKGQQPGSRQIVTNEARRMEATGGTGLSTHAKAALKRMARHKRCNVAVLATLQSIARSGHRNNFPLICRAAARTMPRNELLTVNAILKLVGRRCASGSISTPPPGRKWVDLHATAVIQ